MSIISQFFPGSGGGGDSVPATTTVAELLIVSGGSGGSYTCVLPNTCNHPTGGTGGAVLRSKRFCFEQGVPYTVTIGSGGPAPAGCGSPSSITGGTGCTRVDLVVEGSGICWAHAEQIDAYTNICGHATPAPSLAMYCPSPARWDCAPHGGGGAGGIGGWGNSIACSTPSSSTQFYFQSGHGGPGVMSNITGTRSFYGGGGGGGYLAYFSAQCIPIGGIGGGACGNACPASANTGGGGGGGMPSSPGGGPGGSGVVVIRYPTCYRAAPSVSGNTATPAQPGYNVYRWNGTGSITF